MHRYSKKCTATSKNAPLAEIFRGSGAQYNDRVQKHSKKDFKKQKKSPLKRCKTAPIKGFSLYQKVSSFMAAGLGFEPRQTESESVVLPLHNPAKY